jgi:hypothetical protein
MNENEKQQPKENLTLNPLSTDGPDALDTHDVPHLDDATLIEMEIAWHNTAYGVTIRKADDLFKAAANDTDFIPSGATPTSATFDLKFDDSPHPHKLTIHPPHGLVLEFPSDAPRIRLWLHKRGFRVPRQIIQTCVAFLLAFATAVAPALVDDDGDEDDISSDRRAFNLTT